MRGRRPIAVLVALAAIGAAPARVARACGGGLVSVAVGETSADAQRIFFSAHPDHTDVITEIGVPSTSADYGVLLPVPAQPTLDPQPVPSLEIDTLNAVTAPRVYLSSGGDGGGCGCPLAAGGASKNGGGSGEVTVTAPVNIGPVTAVVLTGDTGDAVAAWLSQNGFAIPAAQQPLVDAYAGAGRFFIAIRRNDSAATGAASSVGVHFTLPGAARTLPLRFAQLGAAGQVTFTVFVAAPSVVAPSDPFAALTLTDLDAATLRASGYAPSVRAAIAAHGGQAFVIEGSYATATLAGRIGPGVEGLFDPGATLTRLTAVLPSSALTDDVAFDGTFAGTPPIVRYVTGERAPPRPSGFGFGGVLAALAIAAFQSRRRPRG
jgi:hypothetical protein